MWREEGIEWWIECRFFDSLQTEEIRSILKILIVMKWNSCVQEDMEVSCWKVILSFLWRRIFLSRDEQKFSSQTVHRRRNGEFRWTKVVRLNWNVISPSLMLELNRRISIDKENFARWVDVHRCVSRMRQTIVPRKSVLRVCVPPKIATQSKPVSA